MITGPIIAELAALVGDPARATMLSSLLDGRARVASELARAAHVTPQTASSHLAKLTGAGLLSMVRRGRHRYFRLAAPAVGDMIDGIVSVALLKRPRHPPLSGEARALAAARICYGHLAGRLSIDLTDALVVRDHVVLHETAAEITTAGARFLTRFGIPLGSLRGSRRHVYRLCLDWTERRPHIAGAIGAALTARCFELGWIEQLADSQAVRVTPSGRQGFRKTFGIDTAGSGRFDHARSSRGAVDRVAWQNRRRQEVAMLEGTTRIPPVDIDALPDDLRATLEDQRARYGAPLHPYLFYARNPAYFRAATAMWTALQQEAQRVPVTLRALLNRRVASWNRCEF